jgi:hypothetical protein
MLDINFILNIAILITLAIIMGINIALLIFTYVTYGNIDTINNGWLNYVFKQIIKFGLVSFLLLFVLFILFVINIKLSIN